jgi:AcrR family transcriptional regulator
MTKAVQGSAGAPGRPNQKMRTRKDLLLAAARLLKQGRKPSLEEIAAEALISRATAYRYFPNVDALLLEASLDVAVPGPDELFDGFASSDVVARLERVDTALYEMMQANEAALRLMLAQSLAPRDDGSLPARQNRRTPLIEAALEPVRAQLAPSKRALLSRAAAALVGIETLVVFKDVLQLDDAEARKVRRWALRALVDAARKA